MARRRRKPGDLPTVWQVPDDLWDSIIHPLLLELDPPAKTGRPRTDPRRALDGIIYVLRTGCQWNALPKEFGDDSSVHRTLQRWIDRGVFKAVWGVLIEHCEELGGVNWKWQAADAAMGKARFGGIMSARIPRIGPRTAASAAPSSRPMAGRWAWSSPPPM
jgi:putative transposase